MRSSSQEQYHLLMLNVRTQKLSKLSCEVSGLTKVSISIPAEFWVDSLCSQPLWLLRQSLHQSPIGSRTYCCTQLLNQKFRELLFLKTLINCSYSIVNNLRIIFHYVPEIFRHFNKDSCTSSEKYQIPKRQIWARKLRWKQKQNITKLTQQDLFLCFLRF